MIKSEWTYKDVILNIETIKSEYLRVLLSFSILEKKKKLEYMRKCKQEVYNLKTLEWKRNTIWKYLNNESGINTSRYLINTLDIKE